MKHVMNLAKSMLAAAVVLEVGSRIGPKLPDALVVKAYDTRPIVAGGLALFGVLTAVGLVGGKKLESKLIPGV